MQARKGVMAAEEWKNENNRDLSFFRDGGITNSPCSTDTLDPPVPLSGVMTWRTAGSSSEGCVKGERSSDPEFSCSPLSPWQPVLTGKNLWRVTENYSPSGVRADIGSTPEQKQETKRLKTEIKTPLKITDQTSLVWKKDISLLLK